MNTSDAIVAWKSIQKENSDSCSSSTILHKNITEFLGSLLFEILIIDPAGDSGTKASWM